MQAILITAYKNAKQIENIIDFFGLDFNIYIHIDYKSKEKNEIKRKLSTKKNVKYVSDKYKINWGGINHLLAILELAQQALLEKNNQYFHLITGHDFPIKTKEQFTLFYNEHKDHNFIENNPLPYSPWPEGGLDRLSRYNFYDIIDARSGWKEIFVKRISKLQKSLGITRKFKKDFPPLFGGSTYWSLNRSALGYVFEYMKTNPSFLKRFKYTFCSEEIFFQTILMNSPIKNSIINNNLRFIVWENRNGNFPANLDMSDYSDISKSDALFARKFEFPVSSGLLNKLQYKN